MGGGVCFDIRNKLQSITAFILQYPGNQLGYGKVVGEYDDVGYLCF